MKKTRWERLWEKFLVKEDQGFSFTGPYHAGRVKTSEDLKENVDNMLKLSNTLTNLFDVDLSQFGSKNDIDSFIDECSAVNDDMFILLQKIMKQI